MKMRVLFVCLGNICRSPTAEGAFRRLLEQEGLTHAVEVDSAATHDYHQGCPPDARAQATARQRGVDLSKIRARQIVSADFERFDYVVAMDRDDRAVLEAQCPRVHRKKIHLLLRFAQDLGDEIADPYYGGHPGFEQVYDLVEAGIAGLLREIRGRLDD